MSIFSKTCHDDREITDVKLQLMLNECQKVFVHFPYLTSTFIPSTPLWTCANGAHLVVKDIGQKRLVHFAMELEGFSCPFIYMHVLNVVHWPTW
jgi:hypothetical protein